MRNNGAMSTVFELIIAGTIPGRFLWADDQCVVIETIEPVANGHALVIPRDPIDKWTDLPPKLLDHLMRVAQIIGSAQEEAFGVPRSTVVIAGFEVPHTHVHVIPAKSEADALLSNARPGNDTDMDNAAHALREVLRGRGYSEYVPMEMDSPRTA